jgi:phosphatidylinositol-3-phosphatase
MKSKFPLLAICAAISSGIGVAVSASPLATLRQIKTVFVVPLENHDWTQASPTSSPQQLFGNAAAPYINSLCTPGNPNAAQVSYATRYYNAGQGVHPSEPSYIWSEAGTTFGVYTDNDPSTSSGNLFTCQHLCGQLNAAGIAWKSYQEDVQYSSSAAVSAYGSASVTNIYNGSYQYDYRPKHNPMEFFTDTINHNVYPLAQLWTDLADNAIGRYNWVTPDQYNEMHSALGSGFTYHGVHYTGDQAAIAEGDHCLSIIIPRIMASSAYQDHGLIIIWTDETEHSDDTNSTIADIIISPLAKGNAYASSVVYSHSSDLKTMDEIFGLDLQTNAIPARDINAFGTGYNTVVSANDLGDMFMSAPSFIGAQALPGSEGFQLTFSGPEGQRYHVLSFGSLNLPVSAWTVIGNGTFGSTNAIFTDSAASLYPARFYSITSP